MKILIIGAGTVGKALGGMITNAGHTVDYLDYKLQLIPTAYTEYDICHVTIPMVDLDTWVSCVYAEYKNYKITTTIIESSIIPQDLDDLAKLIPTILIYSPIRATEAIMPKQLKALKKYWAFLHAPPANEQLPLLNYLHSIYPQGTVRFHDAKALAFGKMLEVVDFGLQIMFAQQVKLACDELGCHFEEAYTEYRKHSSYGADYNKLKKGAPVKWIPRAIFRPDVIKGKCVIQDAQLLNVANLLPSLMNEMIVTNDLFKEYLEKTTS